MGWRVRDMDYTMITVKLVTAFFGLWLMTKLLGKKEISQLTPFDFISSLMLSELVGNTIYDRGVHFMMLIYALVLWMVLSLALEKIVQIFPWLSVPQAEGRILSSVKASLMSGR